MDTETIEIFPLNSTARRPRRAARLQEHHESRDGAGRAGAGTLGARVGACSSDDTRYMSDALRVMGFTVEIDETARRITVSGRAERSRAWRRNLRRGAGTVMRFIVAMVTLGEGRSSSTGISGCVNGPIGRSSTRCSASARACTASAQQLSTGDRRCVARALRRRRDVGRCARVVAVRVGDADAAPIWNRAQAAP